MFTEINNHELIMIDGGFDGFKILEGVAQVAAGAAVISGAAAAEIGTLGAGTAPCGLAAAAGYTVGAKGVLDIVDGILE